MAQLGQQHPVPEALLQLHGGGQLLLQAGLHPAEAHEPAVRLLGLYPEALTARVHTKARTRVLTKPGP